MEDTKMKNILDELYDYDLFHLTEIEDTDGAYRAALDRLVKAEAELKKAYPDNNEILDEYQSADIELHDLSNRNEFRKGFKVGAQLVLEMLKPIKWAEFWTKMSITLKRNFASCHGSQICYPREIINRRE